MKKNQIVNIISIIFFALFAYTAVNKFISIRSLYYILRGFPIMGIAPKIFAWILPIFETIVVGFLYFKRDTGVWLSTRTMIIFTIYVGGMLALNPHMPCTCGGLLQKLSWPEHLILNMTLVGLGIWAEVLIKQIKKQPDVSKKRYRAALT